MRPLKVIDIENKLEKIAAKEQETGEELWDFLASWYDSWGYYDWRDLYETNSKGELEFYTLEITLRDRSPLVWKIDTRAGVITETHERKGWSNIYRLNEETADTLQQAAAAIFCDTLGKDEESRRNNKKDIETIDAFFHKNEERLREWPLDDKLANMRNYYEERLRHLGEPGLRITEELRENALL